MNKTIKTLHRVVDYLIDATAEDICAICVFENSCTPLVTDGEEPCFWRRTNGKKACKNGIIEYFQKEL